MQMMDVEMSSVPRTIDINDVVNVWLEKLNKGVLSGSHFKEYWRTWVPRIYSPPVNENCLNWCFNEDEATRILFNSLELFICRNQQDKDNMNVADLSSLAKLDRPPSVCGRVFKMGEPTYSCRECGADNTCVLCVDCFKQSEHRRHKYKMGTSGGGGCCDCGDREAWKQSPFCDVHIAGVQEEERQKQQQQQQQGGQEQTTTAGTTEEESDGKEQSNHLPSDFIERTRIVFDAILWHAYNLLTLEHTIDLRLPDDSLFDHDTYCTILYNDEVHTFEQVITTLSRTIKCDQRTSIEYVTNIDREGRAIVKCSNFVSCNELKTDIERHTSRQGNKPLKVLVVHAYTVAHQIFAMKLLTWLQTFLGHGERFRNVFTQVVLQTQQQSTNPSIVKGIMLRDSQLWKSARTHWHRLLISGMLLEYENKKALAKVFTKNYGCIMKDFIKDDHDHSFSISSLSVQLFTVPTLAYHLIENDEVLFILLNTFISECSRKVNKNGKLEFERNSNGLSFQRAQYMLYDLRYLLGAVPESWTDNLRSNFLHGLSVLLDILTMMQGMDAVTRQVGQHMEYEPEWKSAFNLHIKLSYSISLALKWCGTDKVVLVKAYRATLAKLQANPCYEVTEPGQLRELVEHSVTCLSYDISSKPVSIHLPLSRFLAGLHLHLERYGLGFDSTELQLQRPSPVQMIEPALRTQVMISQVHAGMWRRNGYALLNQLYFYHDVKCRTEMLDRDITILQIGSALIESNEFLIHLLNRFGLINWIQSNYETNYLKNAAEDDNMRQIVNLVEEFLQLLVTIVGERYVPGVSATTPEERVRKEIIQHLCIKPLPHSELNKCIPEDITYETGLDDVVEQLAVFKKPSLATGKGVYELKPEYLPEYNVFYYHYTREELSKSEENQRKKRKDAGQLECCPPPQLPLLTPAFHMIVNLFQCDVMLHIMHTILERCVNLRARSFSELQLHKILHLIGYALQEEQSGHYPFLLFVEKAYKWKLPGLLEQLANSARVESHRDLIKWTLNKFKDVNTTAEKNSLDLEKEEERQTSSSGSFVVSEMIVEANNEKALVMTEKARRAKLAAERREKVMAQMTAMQNSFMKDNAELFEETNTELSAAAAAAAGNSATTSMELKKVEEVSGDDMVETVALGLNQSARVIREKTFTCILCQEEQSLSTLGPCLVMAAFVQQATVLCRHRGGVGGKTTTTSTSSPAALPATRDDPLYLNANLGPAPHTSTCGHVMHSTCWQKYFDNVMTKERKRPYRLRHPASFDVDRQEFLCPLCECLSNTVLPILPALSRFQQRDEVDEKEQQREETTTNDNVTFEEYLCGLNEVLSDKKKWCQTDSKLDSVQREEPLEQFEIEMAEDQQNQQQDNTNNAAIPSTSTDSTTTSNTVTGSSSSSSEERRVSASSVDMKTTSSVDMKRFLRLFSTQTTTSTHLSDELKDMIQIFAQVTYTRGLDVDPNPTDRRLAPIAWKSCAYTLHAIETLLRDTGDKPLLGQLSSRHRDCLENLVRTVSILGSTWPQSVVIVRHALRLLEMLLLGGGQEDSSSTTILEWDSLGYLISLTLALPSLMNRDRPASLPTGGLLDLHTLRLLFIAHIVKIVIGMDLERKEEMEEEEEMEMETGESDDESGELLKELVGVIGRRGMRVVLVGDVEEACRPFLRACVLFYHYVTDVPAPRVLTELAGDTYGNMCRYLGLPITLSGLFDLENNASLRPLIARWCNTVTTTSSLLLQPLRINRLVELPLDYSELINTVSSFTCPNSDHEDSRNPTMCLVCGEILCSQSYCCQTDLGDLIVGACNYHAHRCGAGVGLFLRVRECEIMFLASPFRGCFVSPPYLDDYGETDQGLRRGNPLRLCPVRYRKLNGQWLSHGIHEEIARSIESSNNIIPTQWQHL